MIDRQAAGASVLPSRLLQCLQGKCPAMGEGVNGRNTLACSIRLRVLWWSPGGGKRTDEDGDLRGYTT